MCIRDRYYELYQKYQQDYQIAEILKGQPSEAMVKKVSHASFDERVDVYKRQVQALEYGRDTFLFAFGIAAGMSIAWAICYFLRSIKKK